MTERDARSAAVPGSACWLIPGDWSTPTGGFQYDRRLVDALTAARWTLDVRHLDADWPRPDAAAQARSATVIGSIADGTCVVADGLAYGALPDLVAAHSSRLRWVALVHHPLHLETGLMPAVKRHLLDQEGRALSFARRVIVTSPRTARDVASMGVPPDRIAVIEPGTDPAESLPALRLTRCAGLVNLLCVATVTPRKAHAVLLQALAGLTARNWRLHCVGSLTRDPATATRVQAIAGDAALAGRVIWHGEVDDAALRAHYAAADLLVLPSLHEGYGMVVAEALAAGVPVLASDAGALPQTLPAQAGRCVPAGDVAALRAALEELIAQPARLQALAAGAREAGQRLPDWPAQAQRFAAVLQGL